MNMKEIKQMNLVEFLSRCYGMRFQHQGGQWAALSPFNTENRPSFMVHCQNGQWLFKDFSSDLGGSIIDFVMLKENLSTRSEALGFVNRIAGTVRHATLIEEGSKLDEASYDLNSICETIRTADSGPAYDYLERRGIGPALKAKLMEMDIVRVNRIKETTYCCFEVRDEFGELRCLDNHEIGGPDKFVLGRKVVFTLDHERLKKADRVFVVEGIIDCLSILEIEGHDIAAAALLGVSLKRLPSCISSAREIVAAVDADDAGISAIMDLQDLFSDRTVTAYDLEDHKDPNELLQTIKAQKRKSLSHERRMELYEDYVRSERKSEVAERWGVDRSYMYEVVRDCRRFIREGYQQRTPGRRSNGEPKNMNEALARIDELERERNKIEHEKELYYVRSELTALRLKYAELETAELRGESTESRSTDEPRLNQKHHVKKKKKRKRSR